MMKGLKIALFGLAVTVGGVLGATTGGQETAAMPCCSSCDSAYNRCITNCAGNSDCEMACEERWFSCSGYCSFSC